MDPAAGMRVTVANLGVTVTSGTKRGTAILQNVCFEVPASRMVALIGPSGAGKTTLLNRVAGRGTSCEVSGKISYGGRALEEVRQFIGFVTQDDIMYETLTPRENLSFAAAFLQAGLSATERADVVKRMLERLRLTKCADTAVGTPGLVVGISGGERKRTNVGMSLLGNPRLLLLDEPTSGLDSRMSFELMRDVRAISDQGCTVFATIHQPSEATFSNFSDVALLAAGQLVYFGPVEGFRERIVGLGFEVPVGMPLPDFLLDAVLTEGDADAKLTTFVETLRVLTLASFDSKSADKAVETLTASTRLGFRSQLVVLLGRNLRATAKNPMLTWVRTMQTLMASLLIALIFFRLDHSFSSVQQRFMGTFLVIMANYLFALLGVVNTFPAERAVFLREVQDRWYHPVAFYISKVLLDTLMQSLFPVLSTLVVYWIVGYNTQSPERFGCYYLVLALVSNCASAMGLSISAAVPSVSVALAVAPGSVMPQLLLSGVFLSVKDMPLPFQWVSYLVPFKYCVQALMANEFTCEENDACDDTWRFKPEDECEDSPCDFCCTDVEREKIAGLCPVLTCEHALEAINMDADSIWPSGETTQETFVLNVLYMTGILMVLRLHGLMMLLVSYRRAARSG